MSYIFDGIPYFKALLRREFTVNLQRHHGEYLPVHVVGVRMVRGRSIWFQTWIQDGYGAGAMFLVPIHALATKPCKRPPAHLVQPWDVFSPHFTVARIPLFQDTPVHLLPGRLPGRYLMTFDFEGTDLADDIEQHKHLHLLAMQGGWFAAVPNNRVLVEDTAFIERGVMTEKLDFVSLGHEFWAEGTGDAGTPGDPHAALPGQAAGEGKGVRQLAKRGGGGAGRAHPPGKGRGRAGAARHRRNP